MKEADSIRAFFDRNSSRQAEWSSLIGTPVVDVDSARRRVREGSSWVEPSEIRVDTDAAAAILGHILCDLRSIAVYDTPALAWLQDMAARGRFSAADLLTAVLRHDSSEVCRLADDASVPAQALHFLGIFLARPFLVAALRDFDPALVNIEDARGACPGCGSGAALSILLPEEGHRRLWCRCCGLQWPVKRLQCPWCGTSDVHRLGYFTVEGLSGRRVDFCQECRRYIKTRDLHENGAADAPFLAEVEDLLSAELDGAALHEGFLPMAHAGVPANEDPNGSANSDKGRC
jgi:FdhE protein